MKKETLSWSLEGTLQNKQSEQHIHTHSSPSITHTDRQTFKRRACACLVWWNSMFFVFSLRLLSPPWGRRHGGWWLLGFHVCGCPRTVLCIFHLLREGAKYPRLWFNILFTLLHLWKPLFSYVTFNVLVAEFCLWFFILTTSLMSWEEKAILVQDSEWAILGV